MRKLFLFMYLLLTIIAVTSCTIVKMSHGHVMDRKILVQSKDDIIKTFGVPTEKRVSGTNEIWYNALPKRMINNGFPKEPINFISAVAADTIPSGKNSFPWKMLGKYRYYITISFENDRPVKWSSEGIDFTLTEKSKALTGIAIALGTLAVAIPIGLVIAISIGFR